MECKEIYDLICAYMDEELDQDIRDSIEKHINSCAICKSEISGYLSIRGLIRKRLSNISAPETLRKRIASEMLRINDYRESGISALDLVPWGTHVAHLYKERDDLIEVLIPYIAKGLEQNERCIWITLDISKDGILNSLKKELPDAYKYMDKGQLGIINYEDWYLPDGSFGVERTVNNALNEYRRSISEGYSGFRCTGTLSWLDSEYWDSFMEYERLLDSKVPGSKLLIICSYKEGRHTRDGIHSIMSSHKFLLSRMNRSWRIYKEDIV